MSCKIYKIKCNITGNVYIGSTKLKLKDRISLHISNNNNPNNNTCSSDIIIKNNDWYYEIIEECDISIRYERERYYINNTEKCINKFKMNGPDWEKKKKNEIEYDKKRKDCPIRKAYCKKRDFNIYHWEKSWGGDKRSHNNLLQIDINLFKQ